MNNFLRLSVHQLVDYLLRSGDIDNRVFSRATMNEGSAIHARYQSSQSSDYISEYPLKHLFVIDEFEVLLEGRADGIIKKKNGDYIIDEIKSTVIDLVEFKNSNLEWHLGQAKCYALMFAIEQKLEYIGIRLTYIRQGKEKEKLICNYDFSISDLDQFVHSLIEEYLLFYNIIRRKNEVRNESIFKLTFPFNKFRSGQRELSKCCYAIAKKGGKFFAEAPTGIGKTMSTLFPFIKGFCDDEEAKIFYLTAKASGKESANSAIKLLKEKGLELTHIVITAKDKICPNKNGSCNPDECPFAKGYYSKIQAIIQQSLLTYNTFDFVTIMDIAIQNEVCPFELELDLSLFSDVIICDYNYLFDPISYMKRYFDEDSSHYLALIDEAHNLIDRSRDMYSSSLSYEKFLDAKKSVRHSKLSKLKLAISKMNKMFKDVSSEYPEGENVIDDFPTYIYKALSSFLTTILDVNKYEHKEMTKELTGFYLDVLEFSKIAELINDKYLIYIKIDDHDIKFNISCLDASSFLRSITTRIKGSVFFSATLSPMEYYVNTLGGNVRSDPTLILPSPFPINNLKLMVAPNVSVKYKNRESSYEEVAKYIKSFISQKVGNYFVFLPSYEYLDNIVSFFFNEPYDCYIQEKDMDDYEKEEFLLNFQENPARTALGFLVLGGSFSEGIDLVNDRLIGAVIVGIGMPKINFESNQIKEYFNANDLPGYDYAYLNPGMNKVMQAVGRVIRSEKDRGAVLLIDERYLNRQYQNLFKIEWSNYEVVYSPKEVENILKNFF